MDGGARGCAGARARARARGCGCGRARFVSGIDRRPGGTREVLSHGGHESFRGGALFRRRRRGSILRGMSGVLGRGWVGEIHDHSAQTQARRGLERKGTLLLLFFGFLSIPITSKFFLSNAFFTAVGNRAVCARSKADTPMFACGKGQLPLSQQRYWKRAFQVMWVSMGFQSYTYRFIIIVIPNRYICVGYTT